MLENRVIKCNPASQAGMSGKLERRWNAPRRLVGTREEKDSRISIQFCQRMDPFTVTLGLSRDLSRTYRSLQGGNLVDRCPLEGLARPKRAE